MTPDFHQFRFERARYLGQLVDQNDYTQTSQFRDGYVVGWGFFAKLGTVTGPWGHFPS